MFNHKLVKKPKDLESYVQYVYSSLLNLKDEGVVVGSNATFIGRSGAKHEIDVFYQFERSGLTHRVAFECKFTGRRVPKSDVIDFHGKLQDIGNLQGVFVSKSGYQAGAIEYAKHYDIELLKLGDLPTINILLAKRIKSVALPDESYVGEPFWVLMETENGQVTGSYWSKKEGKLFKKSVIPMFVSKFDANTFLLSIKDSERFVVRGIPQHSLNFLLKSTIALKSKVEFALMLTGCDESGLWPAFSATPEELMRRFLINDGSA